METACLGGWLARESNVDLRVIDHKFPAPLAELWSRPDLGCAFMCGFPYRLAQHPPKPVAAPLPAGAGKPIYATRLVVRADSAFDTLQDTFGGRLGFTVEDSHSGYNALRHHLLPYRQQRGANLYCESVGPLTTPRRVIDALLAGAIDVGPLDGYAMDLMLRHDPGLVKQLRTIAYCHGRRADSVSGCEPRMPRRGGDVVADRTSGNRAQVTSRLAENAQRTPVLLSALRQS